MSEALSFDFLARDGVSRVCDEISGRLDHLHGRFGHMAKVGAGALLTVGASAVGAGLSTLKMAADFQEGMTTLVTGAGESEKNMKLVHDGVLNMAGAVGTSTKQLTAGMYMVESAGFHGAAGLNVLKVAAEGAKVGATDLGTMANAVTSALNAYHQPAAKAAAVTNTLIATVSAGKMHMSELASSLGAVLPAASAAHLSLAQVGGAMATMTAQGTPAADAATYLRQTILNLMNPTAKARDEMKSLGLNFLDISKNLGRRGLTGTFDILTEAITRHMGKAGTVLIEHLKSASHNTSAFQKVLANLPPTQQSYVAALASMVGGTKSMQAALELTGGNAKTFAGNVEAITKSVNEGGTKVRGWAEVQKDFNTQLSQAKETVSALGIRIGEKLLPVGERFLKWLLGLITQLTDGTKHTRGFAGFIESDLVPAVKKIAGWVKDTLIPALRDLAHWFQDKVMPVIVKIAKDVLPVARKQFDEVGKTVAKNRPELDKLAKAFKILTDFILIAVIPLWGPVLKAVIVGIGTNIRFTITVVQLLTKTFSVTQTVMTVVLRTIITVFLGFVRVMLEGAVKAFGWVPGLGDKLRSAAKSFDRFATSVNRAINSITPGKTIKVTAFGYIGGSGAYAHKPLPLAEGGRVPLMPGSRRGRDSVPALLMPDEFVVRSDGSNLGDALAHFGRGMASGGIAGKAFSALGQFPAAFDKAVTTVFTKAMQKVIASLGSMTGGSVGGGAAQWAGLVLQVLAMLGQSPANLAGVLRRINFESGGNANAINLTDSNARAGHPSQGLMQTIPGTFAAYAGPFARLGITNPLANIYAGLNYAIHRYGSIAAIDPLVRPMGYAAGGVISEPIFGVGRSGRTYMFGEHGRETVTPGVGAGGAGITINGNIVLNGVQDPAGLVHALQDYCRSNGVIRKVKLG